MLLLSVMSLSRIGPRRWFDGLQRYSSLGGYEVTVLHNRSFLALNSAGFACTLAHCSNPLAVSVSSQTVDLSEKLYLLQYQMRLSLPRCGGTEASATLHLSPQTRYLPCAARVVPFSAGIETRLV